jgi:hypothetical protein
LTNETTCNWKVSAEQRTWSPDLRYGPHNGRNPLPVYIWQGINNQNIQVAQKTELPKNQGPSEEMGKWTKYSFFKGKIQMAKKHMKGGIGNKERERDLKLECGWCVLCRGVIKVILNWQRALWEGDWEVVKKSGRWINDGLQQTSTWKEHYKSPCIAIFISSYQKHCVFCIISYVFSSSKSEKNKGWGVLEGGGRWPKQCIHM